MVSCLGVILCGDRAGLLVEIAHRRQRGIPEQGLVEMHRSPARHEEGVLDSLLGDEADDVVRQLHHDEAPVAVRADSRLSITSRTAPFPPPLVETKAAARRTRSSAPAGAAAS